SRWSVLVALIGTGVCVDGPCSRRAKSIQRSRPSPAPAAPCCGRASSTDYKGMAVREARRKDGIEAVAIVTPNHLHYPIAREFLKRKIHVICDKPLTSTLADAKKLVKLV